MKLGRVLVAYREAHALEGRQLAEQIGIGPSILSRIENGKTCGGRTLVKILLWLTGEK